MPSSHPTVLVGANLIGGHVDEMWRLFRPGGTVLVGANLIGGHGSERSGLGSIPKTVLVGANLIGGHDEAMETMSVATIRSSSART